MWFPVVAWIVLLSASAFFAGTALDLNPAQIAVHFSALAGPQRFALGAVIFTTLSLIGVSVFQAYSLARQNEALRHRLRGLREGVVVAHGSQDQFNVALQHLADSDPEEAIASLQGMLADTEQRAALQQGRSESADLQDRIDEIRRRQQSLRETIGVVAEKRRVIEPVFGELRDRLRQLERSLSDIEVDDNKRNLADRVKELDQNVALIHARQSRVNESLATLSGISAG